MNATPIIDIRSATKLFPGGVRAVDNVSLAISEGEFFALLGPSGCGKTTLLRMLAGFETPSSGQILIDGRNMAGVAPNTRPVNMVFQSYAVFPHMSVFDNVAYGLKVSGARQAEVRKPVEEALALVKLDGYGARMPDQLSGGQRQRVALARALVKRPRVLLLDEPLSALDAKLREAMQLELANLQKTVGITFVIVTHDQSEALSMADRIAVMESGAVRQVAGPTALYEAPANRFVADFIGQVNLFPGTVSKVQGKRTIVVSRQGGCTIAADAANGVAPGQDCWVALRPEKIAISASAPARRAHNNMQGTIAEIAYLGNHSTYVVMLDDGSTVRVLRTNAQRHDLSPLKAGERIWLNWSAESPVILTE